jgi:aminopeptidase N
VYTKDENYTIVVDYTAKPETKPAGGSRAISSDKGLYFINPRGEDPNKIPQVWTQGETEASSVWFPTIDRPNQKQTQEIFITVDDKYVTLSNGKFMGSVQNEDGTRTDHWKQELPHVPYLAAMFVGEFKIVEDVYIRPDGTKMPVHYYVEPEWEEHAKAIFGATPEMIEYFSKLLGVPYAWDKYHQVVVRDYVSGAMENTGAVIFGDFVYKTKRELIDANDHSIIAHELFHHWFGDLVTCESWANLPLNESFANYSQFLWDEYYYGLDEAEYNAEKEAQGYYQSSAQQGHHDLIWYDYDEKEDMFDAHSYNKGGRILHMLRNYLGDEAFFESIRHYLTVNAFKPVEVHHLRLAFEEITGEDLNWFFDQWFFGSRHPELKVEMELDTAKTVQFTIHQKQDLDKAPLYKLPMNIAIYDDKGKTTHAIVLDKSKQEFEFPISGTLNNVIVDEDRVLLGSIDFKKPNEFYVHQFYNAPKYKDREEGVNFGSRVKEEGEKLLLDALTDDFWYIRQQAISKLAKVKRSQPEEVFAKLDAIIKSDSSSKVRTAAINFVANNYFEGEFEEKTRALIHYAIEKDSSYMVLAKSLNGLLKGKEKDIDEVIRLADKYREERSSTLRAQIAQIYSMYGNKTHLDYFATNLKQGNVSGFDAIGVLGSMTTLLKEQEPSVQLEYLSFYESLTESSSPYISIVLPMNLSMLQREEDHQVDTLEAKLQAFEKEGGGSTAAQADKTKAELAEMKNLLDEIQSLMMRIQRG